MAVFWGGLLLSAQVVAAPTFLKDYPKKSFHKLTSGPQLVGKTESQWVDEGERLKFSELSVMRLTLFQKPQEISTSLLVTTNQKLEIQRFDFLMKSNEAVIDVKGDRVGGAMRLRVSQSKSVQNKEIQLQEPTLVSPLIRPYLLMKGLTSKPMEHTAALLEPSAMTTIPLSLKVRAEGGDVWAVDVSYLSQTLKSKMAKNGSLISEVSDLAGMPIVAHPVSADEFSKLALQGTKTDLVEIAKVPFEDIPDPRNLKTFSVKISGVDLSSFMLERHRQKLNGNVLTIQVENLPSEGRPVQGLVLQKEFERYLQGDATIPVHDARIQKKAREIVGAESDLWKRAQLIHAYVYREVKKEPTVSVPNALEVLQTMKGDCNEHSALYTALARAAGIPTRTVVGLVYGERPQGGSGFYYHAWVEVFTGKVWIAIDPTWNQLPADATHLAFVEGGLDQQVQVTSLMGRIKFSPAKIPTR